MHGEKATWEYLRFDQADSEEPDLNTLGADGWELVAATNGLVFKRPATSFRERVTIAQKRAVYEQFGLPWPGNGR